MHWHTKTKKTRSLVTAHMCAQWRISLLAKGQETMTSHLTFSRRLKLAGYETRRSLSLGSSRHFDLCLKTLSGL